MFVDTNYPEMMDMSMEGTTWILVVAFVIAFFLAFGVGANDVANSFGTSVGSKVLTLRQACILATIFEVIGAITMGYNVSATIRSGMIHIDKFESEPKLLMMGFLAALIGSTIWNLAATTLGMPISGTHSIVGAIIGFSIVGKGWDSVKWNGLIKIVASWFLSPLLSGIVSLVLFLAIRYFIINRDDALRRGLISLPIFYGVTIFVNIFSIIHEGPHILSKINWWMALLIAGTIAITVGLAVWFVVVPRLRAKILTLLDVLGQSKQPYKLTDSTSIEMTNRTSEPPTTPTTPSDEKSEKSKSPLPATNGEVNGHVNPAFVANGNAVVEFGNGTAETEKKNGTANGGVNGGSGSPATFRVERAKSISFDSEMSMSTTVDQGHGIPGEDDDKPEVAQLFTFLQILTACFGSFAHGGNDVSNAIGPLVAVMLIFRDGNPGGETPWYILLYGGIGISIGLWAWGRIVIQTMGSDLTKITPSTGFTIEIGAAMTVLIASKVGLPISTTHCKVGSVVMVGKAQKTKQGVNWRLFGNIATTWILTVPLTALMSALAMYLLKFAL